MLPPPVTTSRDEPAVLDTHSSAARVMLQRQRGRESSARTYARAFPIVPVRASGMTVETADGRRYLDCLSGAGTLALGHNHPVVLKAIRRTLDSGTPLHTLDLVTAEKDEFTSTLFELLPPSFARHARIHFCGPSGADAVEASVKLMQTATGRAGLLTFTGGYHGMTTGALAATGSVAVKAPLPIVGGITRLPYPYDYRCPFGIGGQAGAEFAAAYTERLLDDPSGGVVPPAAMIVEPVQGEGGAVPAADHWLREMRRITREHGIPLIVDEVQTGVGRTGAMWAVQHSGIVPDAMVLSKAIGGSLPLAVIVYHEDFDGWQPGAHTGTFRGNTLAMAAGTATLRFVAEEGLADRAAEAGERMMARLDALRPELPAIGDARGRGLMIGVELVDAAGEPDRCGSLPPAPELAARVRAACLANGLIVELGGRHDTVVRLLPPLTITDDQIEAVLDRLAEAISAASSPAGGPM
jgi:diaminobutyrate-2-oxoglutarate transaminase